MFKSSVPAVPAKTTSVRVDSSVVLKIVKHVYEHYPVQVCGQLLGFEELEDTKELNISYSFPFPSIANDTEGNASVRSKGMIKYQNDMIDHLKEVNVDANPTGWYVSGNMGRFFNQAVIENMLSYQNTNPESVMLVHDVSKSAQSGFSLKAYRLSPAYLAVRKEGKFTTDNLTKNELSYHTIFEELPVKVSNSHLVTLYLQSIEHKPDYDHLNISIDSYLEKNIEGIFDSVDDFHYDQGNYNYYQRQMSREKLKIQQWQQKRKAENNARQQQGKQPLSTEEWKSLFKLPDEPSRVENLLISGQIDQYCNQIEEFGSSITPKLFAAQKNLEA
ncbi:hypothetical protein TRICI_002620 [Trichomonascus ciferrii]|uniref:Eukaryotic translation initiation factor 3 subunit H n=1 Tax=Trichomonascus ciferrii TaxID=44093 RepID=A0A642VBC5_9ASCO|nr:hypothetical protein TRICI_002620 [Trichomonascus ciferrii]